jgi:hypothetical protein
MNPAAPERAQPLAIERTQRFACSAELATEVDDAQKRLRCVNNRLCTGPNADGIATTYAKHAAAGQIGVGHNQAEMPDVPDPQPMAEQVHWTVHRALTDYQGAAERRRQLVRIAAPWSQRNASGARVRELACPAGQRGGGP